MATVQRKYYPSGKLEEEWFEVNGIKEGEYKYYYKNEQLCQICNYVNGMKEGECKNYDSSGQLAEILNYVNGELNKKVNLNNMTRMET